MKLSNLMLIFAIALFCLFSLQAFWLYYTYKLQLKGIEESLNSIFYQTVERELDQRFLNLEKRIEEKSLDSSLPLASFDIDFVGMGNGIEKKSVISQQITMVKQLMATFDMHFNIDNCDSIFNSILQENKYPFKYWINYTDSTGAIIATSGHDINKGFKTTVLHVIDGEEVYAIVKITAPVVFRNMLAILTVSVLIFFFIIGCIIYEMKMFFNQHHLNQLRENFAHALTHEMKTPLSTIHTVLTQFEKGTIDKNPEMRQKFSSIAIEQVLNLQTTVNQILTLAYIENKQLTLKKETIDFPAMMQSLIDKFTVESNKHVSFKTSCDLNKNIVYADPYFLNVAISNLIDNAIKYSADSVLIEINCTEGEKYIFISIKDNGLGISSNDQLKIFKKFERGAEISRNFISGFGIGLNYTQQVVEAHGGNVSVVSNEGQGSEFIIALPLKLI